jgi:serine/threonine protein kinase
MRTPLALLRFLAKASLNAVGFGVAGDLAVEVLPDVARDVWNWWGQGRSEEELRAEVQALAQLSTAEAAALATQAVNEEAAGRPDTERRLLAGFLTQVPSAIRQSQRRPIDPTGRSVSSSLRLRQAQDLLPLLPSHLPRFQPGQKPLPGVDLQLEELLGVGGFGEVWRARNPYLPEPVALKFCLDPTAGQWLRHEASLLGRVISQGKHPGIVRLQHTYLDAATPCLEYEYVAGGDLAGFLGQWRQAPGATRAEQAIRLMRQLTDIVAFAHRLNPPIVHRDLKPANVLLQPTTGGKFVLRVADFGIGGVAARQAAEQTRRGTTRGEFLASALRGSCTPLYASPQQMHGEPPDPRDDVHALGVIWYQMLTGDLTTGASPDWRDELMERQVPAEMADLLARCLAARAEKRLGNAVLLAEGLAALRPATVVEAIPEAELIPTLEPVGPPPLLPPPPRPSSRHSGGIRRPTPPEVEVVDVVARPRPKSARNLKPHRATLILVLGIVSFFVCPFVLGPVVWFLGSSDLKEMEAGRMDPSGQSQTNVGRLCGLGAAVVGIAFCGLYFLGVLFVVAAH